MAAAEAFRVRSGKISEALGGIFSSTAGPLLPDNIAFKPFNKMWKSPSLDPPPCISNIGTGSGGRTFFNDDDCHHRDGVLLPVDRGGPGAAGALATKVNNINNNDDEDALRCSAIKKVASFDRFLTGTRSSTATDTPGPGSVRCGGASKSLTTSPTTEKVQRSTAVWLREVGRRLSTSEHLGIAPFLAGPPPGHLARKPPVRNRAAIEPRSGVTLQGRPSSWVEDGGDDHGRPIPQIEGPPRSEVLGTRGPGGDSRDVGNLPALQGDPAEAVGEPSDGNHVLLALDYEDNEDLESTISKLRLLLAQRSTTTTTEGDPPDPAGPGSAQTDLGTPDNLQSQVGVAGDQDEVRWGSTAAAAMDHDEEAPAVQQPLLDSVLVDGRLFYNIVVVLAADPSRSHHQRHHQDRSPPPRPPCWQGSSLVRQGRINSFGQPIPEEKVPATDPGSTRSEFWVRYDGLYIGSSPQSCSPVVKDKSCPGAAPEGHVGGKSEAKPGLTFHGYQLHHKEVRRSLHDFLILQRKLRDRYNVRDLSVTLASDPPEGPTAGEGPLQERATSSWMNSIQNAFGSSSGSKDGGIIDWTKEIGEWPGPEQGPVVSFEGGTSSLSPSSTSSSSFLAAAGDLERSKLERWLAEVCGHPKLNSTPELRQFLEYSSNDGSTSGVARHNNTWRNNGANVENSPRIDKLLAQKVSGVFHSIKDALPNFDDEPPSHEVHLGANNDVTNETSVPQSPAPASRNSNLCFKPSTFLLPDFLTGGSTSTTPFISPSLEKKDLANLDLAKAASAPSSDGSSQKNSSSKINFTFISGSTDIGDKSEMETTIDFLIECVDQQQRLTKFGSLEALTCSSSTSRPGWVRWGPAPFADNRHRANLDGEDLDEVHHRPCNDDDDEDDDDDDDGEQTGHLAGLCSNLIEMVLADVLPIFHMGDASKDWMSKTAAYDLARNTLLGSLEGLVGDSITALSSDECWSRWTASLKSIMLADDNSSKVDDDLMYFPTSSSSSSPPHLSELLSGLNVDVDQVNDFFVQVTLSRKVNQDLALSLFDLLMSKLTK